MSSKRKLFLLTTFYLCLCLLPFQLHAQSQVRGVEITSVSSESFPEIEVKVRAVDLNGVVVPGLDTSDFSVLENEQSVNNLQHAEVDEGIVLHILVDGGSTLVNTEGKPRWDRAKSIIDDIALGQPVMINGKDLISVQVVEPKRTVDIVLDSTDGNEISTATAAFDPNIPTTDLANMITAADAALERLNNSAEYVGKSKALLIMSGDLQITQRRQDLISKANRFQIPIHTVLLQPNPTSFTPPLQEIAAGTNGLFTP